MDEKILGEIPLNSWRWLGVNKIKTSAPIEEKFFDVADDETKIFSDVNLSEENVARKIKISVGAGAKVEFISADLGRGDFSSTGAEVLILLTPSQRHVLSGISPKIFSSINFSPK